MEIPRAATPDETKIFDRPQTSKTPKDWQPFADGQWWLLYEGPPDAGPDDHVRAFARIKMGSIRWARRHGRTRALRRREGGRLVWVKFSEPDE